MRETMALALCLDGVEDEELVALAVPWVQRFERIEAWCGHGDSAARELEHLWARVGRRPASLGSPPAAPPPAPPHPPPPRPPHLDVDREQARAIAERGVRLIAEAVGVDATPRVLGGSDAGHAIAGESGPGIALLIGAGHRGGVGPRSVGHVARFVVDHARGPVIVLHLHA